MKLEKPAAFKYLPLTLSFISGILTLAITFGMDYALNFASVDPFGLGTVWQFGPRELVHLTGSLGAVLISWPILQVLFNFRMGKLVYFCTFLYFLSAMIAHRFLVYGESEFRYLLWGGSYIVFLCILLTPNLLKYRNSNTSWFLIFSACFIELFNLWWEIVQQPFIGFRGYAPRGYFQPAQMLCDFLGVVAGLYASYLILKIATKLTHIKTTMQLNRF